jgi:hypothetical protein
METFASSHRAGDPFSGVEIWSRPLRALWGATRLAEPILRHEHEDAVIMLTTGVKES